jgi:hypothetical protein
MRIGPDDKMWVAPDVVRNCEDGEYLFQASLRKEARIEAFEPQVTARIGRARSQHGDSRQRTGVVHVCRR